MPAVTIPDLNNAKIDLGTIAAFVASSAESAEHRFGGSFRTLAGIQADAALVLQGLGYQPPVAYGSGIALTSTTQTVEYSGGVYAPLWGHLPFTTSGTFEAAKFRLVQGVDNATLEAKTVLDVADYAALRSSNGLNKRVNVTGYHVTKAPQGIAGSFAWDPSDTTSADNGISIIVRADGRRYKRPYSKTWQVNWAESADPYGNTDSAAAIAAVIAAAPAGANVVFDGFYRSSTAFTIAKNLALRGMDTRVGNMVSGSVPQACIVFTADTHGIYVNDVVVSLDKLALIRTAASTNYGVYAIGANSAVVSESLSIQLFAHGVHCVDGDYHKFSRLNVQACTLSAYFDGCYNVNLDLPTLNSSTSAGSGGLYVTGGCGVTVLGGSIESFAGYAVYALGESHVTLLGTYFEGSDRNSDVVVRGAGCSITTIGCHVYLTWSRSFHAMDGAALGSRVFSRNNRIVYPTDTGTVNVYAFNNADPLGFADVAGDNWGNDNGVTLPGANVKYLTAAFTGSGTGPSQCVGNFQIQYPAAHPNYGKNVNTVPFCASYASAGLSGTPQTGTLINFGANGNTGDDPISLRTANGAAWGQYNYTAVYQKGQWEKVGLRMSNQADSTAATVADLKADFNSLLAKLRSAGVMV